MFDDIRTRAKHFPAFTVNKLRKQSCNYEIKFEESVFRHWYASIKTNECEQCLWTQRRICGFGITAKSADRQSRVTSHQVVFPCLERRVQCHFGFEEIDTFRVVAGLRVSVKC